jgi:peptide/nickel transport system permease protein
MVAYLSRRLVALLITLMVTSMLIFGVSVVEPIDPAHAVLGQFTTDSQINALRHQMGLDRPLPVRYGDWLWKAAQGDLGESFQIGVPIGPLLAVRLRNSVYLAAVGILMLVPVALVAGILAGLSEGRWPDWLISTLALLSASLPEFVTGVGLILVFAWWLHVLPGNSALTDVRGNPLLDPGALLLPAATLALSQVGHIARLTRVSIARVMQRAYIRTAVLKGLPWWTVVVRHALRNALIAPITVLTTQLGFMISGLIVIESIFAYPGLGRLFAGSAVTNDIPMIEASALLGVTLAVGSQLLADLLYALLNPLIRYS